MAIIHALGKWWSALFLQLHCLSVVIFSIYCLSWLAFGTVIHGIVDFLISDFIFQALKKN